MDALPEEQIRNEINEITTIPYRDRSTEDKQILNALEIPREIPPHKQVRIDSQ